MPFNFERRSSVPRKRNYRQYLLVVVGTACLILFSLPMKPEQLMPEPATVAPAEVSEPKSTEDDKELIIEEKELTSEEKVRIQYERQDKGLDPNFDNLHSVNYNDFVKKQDKGNPGRPELPVKLKQITVLGERNSGTRWTYAHIQDCFDHALVIRRHLSRHKHWFQFEEEFSYKNSTLVLAQFRNPYDWLKAMEHVPHHSPNHIRTDSNSSNEIGEAGNDYQVFLTKPWTMPRVGKDLELAKKAKDEESLMNTVCQDRFLYRDLVSCVQEPFDESIFDHKIRYSENRPFYEMRNDGSGLPYDNIMELRTDKIKNFLSISKWYKIADVWVLRYESMLREGTEELLSRIEAWAGVKRQCKAIAPQMRLAKESRAILKDYASFVRHRIDWETEGLIGYQPNLCFEDDTKCGR